MTGSAQFRLPYMLAFRRAIAGGGRSHNAIVAIVNFERSEFFAFTSHAGCIDDEPTDQTLPRSELVFLNLVAKRAGNTILTETSHAIARIGSESGEDLTKSPLVAGLIPSHRHVTF